MRARELGIIVAFGLLVTYAIFTIPSESALITLPESATSFNPLNWITDSIDGFLNMLKNLFFGWI